MPSIDRDQYPGAFRRIHHKWRDDAKTQREKDWYTERLRIGYECYKASIYVRTAAEKRRLIKEMGGACDD